MTVPDCILMGLGVRTLKPRKDGVRRSRLKASVKKGKTSSIGRGRVCVALMRQIFPCLGWVSGVMVMEFEGFMSVSSHERLLRTREIACRGFARCDKLG